MKADRNNYSVVLTKNYGKSSWVKFVYDKAHNRLFAFRNVKGKDELCRDIQHFPDFRNAVLAVQRMFHLDNIFIDENYTLNCWDYCCIVGTDITEQQLTDAIRHKCKGMIACSKITKFAMMTSIHHYHYQVTLECDKCGKKFVEWREHDSMKMIDYSRDTICDKCKGDK